MKAPHKVLFLTYYWPPSGGAGVQRTLKFVRYLPEFGIHPVVVTVDPYKASYPVQDESLLEEIPAHAEVYRTSSFEPLNYLAKFAGKEKVPYGGFSNTSGTSKFQYLLRWIRGNFFLPDARRGWVKYAVKTSAALIRKYGIDTVYISSPPHSSQLIGLKLKSMFPGIRWLADLRDPWTKIYYYPELLHTALAKKLDAGTERKVLKSADEIIVVSEAIKRDYAELGQIDAGKIHVLPNGYDEENFSVQEKSPAREFIISYIGTLAESYNPLSLLEVLGRFTKQHTGIKLRFVGVQAPAVRRMMEEHGLMPVTEFIAYVPHLEAIQFMQQSAVNLLLIPDSKGAEGILTGKLFEYLGAEKPILGIGPAKGDAAAIVNECAAGKFFERNEQAQILAWLEEQYASWKGGSDLRNTAAIHKKYTRRALSAQLAGLLNRQHSLQSP